MKFYLSIIKFVLSLFIFGVSGDNVNDEGEQQVNYDYYSRNAFPSGYSVSFQRCQRVKYYNDEAAQEAGVNGPLVAKQFVIFRLCENSDWNNMRCGNCNSNYGEYVMEANDYLEATIGKAQETLEEICNQCNGGYQCPYECQNLYNNNIPSAENYIECQEIGEAEDGSTLYVGPRCSSDGSSIHISIFKDNNCWYHTEEYSLKDFFDGVSISHHLFYYAVRNGKSCFPCGADNDGNMDETCDDLYSASAKCELKNGLDSGLLSEYAYDDRIYENQLANEYEVCTFINSIVSGSYDNKEGDIVLRSYRRQYMSTEVTATQRTSLLALSLTIFSLLVYIMYLHSYINIHSKWLGKSQSFILIYTTFSKEKGNTF